MPQDDPDFRATITHNRLSLVGWHDQLFRPSAPAAHHFRPRAGVVIADLTVIRDDDGNPEELIVAVHSGTLRGAPRRRLLDWAAALGYRRVWLPDEIVELEPDEGMGELAETRCPNCRARWADREFEFWSMVRRSGFFPLVCPVCGGDLPQWAVAH
jgi:hypothetical protein